VPRDSGVHRLSRWSDLVPVLAVALLLRIGFWMPHYLTSDALDYLSASHFRAQPGLFDAIHVARLGMVAPLALLGWVGPGSVRLAQMYPLLCSLGLVVLAYGMGCRWGGAQAGRLAAWVMVWVPMEVVYGTVVLPDTPLSLWAVASLWLLSVRGAEAGRVQDSVRVAASGACVGLAYTCKEPALFLALPAVAQAYLHRRRPGDAAIWLAGLAAVLLVEALVLWLWWGRVHLRILETIGFVWGSKGNYADVERSAGWWLAQILFKLKALFAAADPPTAALLVAVPHLVVVAAVLLWRQGTLGMVGWPLAWGGTWVAQQLLLSSIEQEPRYYQAALPYASALIGLGFAGAWRSRPWLVRWSVACALAVMCLAGATFFGAGHAPRAAATKFLLERLPRPRQEPAVVGAASVYLRRLALYGGCRTDASAPGPTAATHYIRMMDGYSRDPGEVPARMQLCARGEFANPLQPAFEWLGYHPRIGFLTTAEVYCVRSREGES
jgi:hypothetical protein